MQPCHVLASAAFVAVAVKSLGWDELPNQCIVLLVATSRMVPHLWGVDGTPWKAWVCTAYVGAASVASWESSGIGVGLCLLHLASVALYHQRHQCHQCRRVHLVAAPVPDAALVNYSMLGRMADARLRDALHATNLVFFYAMHYIIFSMQRAGVTFDVKDGTQFLDQCDVEDAVQDYHVPACIEFVGITAMAIGWMLHVLLTNEEQRQALQFIMCLVVAVTYGILSAYGDLDRPHHRIVAGRGLVAAFDPGTDGEFLGDASEVDDLAGPHTVGYTSDDDSVHSIICL